MGAVGKLCKGLQCRAEGMEECNIQQAYHTMGEDTGAEKEGDGEEGGWRWCQHTTKRRTQEHGSNTERTMERE